jgi:predicted PurR-regulated permease PerM
MGVATGAAVVAVAILEAYILTPWFTSRAGAMNTPAVFIGLIFWGWVWGLPGLLLAVPLLMVIKTVCAHVEVLQPIATLLGE